MALQIRHKFSYTNITQTFSASVAEIETTAIRSMKLYNTVCCRNELTQLDQVL
ncbi:hypothetical protein RO3G_06315 [Rhizopus delemar RA 99-880]|uniref:Uncharacterized protein n=1 Tax=Rhizopus delemar (strain RA 99-880 / ATCC MYA-4621 / FGSC 9543 / NRRL 43880) TaxID=246409 RepID=I1BZI0_RHIO9|nr:hypothetical protein RO3G_06315 [Rhizopus delemar RA 99-880]|eukprot:EIE81610.1 hypothetical protein RO3G_06315 [Rhizopus delemar RA 99-880]